MNRILTTAAAIAFILGGAGTISAESHMEEMMKDKEMQSAQQGKVCSCKMHGKDMRHSRRAMQNKMPMDGKMMNRQIVSTADGGVVIVMGPYILKYDAELNLVKKTEIDLGPEDMQRMMKRRKEMQDMMHGMMMSPSEGMSKDGSG